jgi:hypothetical protein
MHSYIRQSQNSVHSRSVHSRIGAFAAVFAALCTLTSATAEDYPHAYPREGVTKIFENERGIVWDVHWLPGIPQPYHRHQYDMAGVYLRYGPITVTQLDGSVNPQRPPFAIPRPYFQPAGVTHKEEMIGFPEDSPQRWAVMFDLKEIDKPPVALPTGVPAFFPRSGAEAAIDNERVTHWDYTWSIGETVERHMHNKDSLQVFYQAGSIQFTDAQGNVRTEDFAYGDVRYIEAGTIESEVALSGPPKAITIEVK